MPYGEQFLTLFAAIPLCLIGAHTAAADHSFQNAIEPADEIVFINIAFIGGPIPHMQMLQHIIQRPALKLRRRIKSGIVQILHQSVKRVAFGFKIQSFIQHGLFLFLARINGD